MRRAFTLIELLVVVSIIALLIAILLPALGSAKRAARLTICGGSNVKQLYTAALAYSTEHKGILLSGTGGGVNSYTNNYPSALSKARNSNTGWIRWGKLYDLGYANDPTIFYCPESPYSGGYDESRWTSASGTTVQTAYDYNPVLKERSGNRHWSNLYENWNDAETKGGLETILVMDIAGMNAKDTVSHKTEPGWNVGLIDGSVSFRKDQEAFDSMYDGWQATYKYDFANHKKIVDRLMGKDVVFD